MRKFQTGATRDSEAGKLDFEGFLSPLVLERYAVYMNENRTTDYGYRGSDNWQLGIPQAVYIKSMWRHFFAVWKTWREWDNNDLEEQLCALLFNVMGMLHERLARREDRDDKSA